MLQSFSVLRIFSAPSPWLLACAMAFTVGSAWSQSTPPPLYQVVEGRKVDAETMKGFRAWRAGACDRCHGANQEGMVGPSLITSLKTLSKDEFIKVMADGRPEKGMPNWAGNPSVMNHINQLYAYLKGRSDGAITQAKVEPLP